MSMTKYRAIWSGDYVWIEADFSVASCPVKGTNGRQVADFKHRPKLAMRYALERMALADGLDPENVDDAVDVAMDTFEVVAQPILFNVTIAEDHDRFSFERALVHWSGPVRIVSYNEEHNYVLLQCKYSDANDFEEHFLNKTDSVAEWERID